ncbi:LOW QUALITY PROTEIN: recQ-mediated genome instability protein 2 [Liasis olivaceus]
MASDQIDLLQPNSRDITVGLFGTIILCTVKIGGKEAGAMMEKPCLRSPPVKVLAAQLKRCRQLPGGSWLLDREEYGRPALVVSLVWMQGKVLTVEQDGSTVRLLDESGSFVVSGVEGVPKGKPCLSPGNYVMVMGLVQGCIPEPVLQAVKMTDLSGNPLHRSMWELEVEDLQRSLLS